MRKPSSSSVFGDSEVRQELPVALVALGLNWSLRKARSRFGRRVVVLAFLEKLHERIESNRNQIVSSLLVLLKLQKSKTSFAQILDEEFCGKIQWSSKLAQT
jgi:hypothetical protein